MILNYATKGRNGKTAIVLGLVWATLTGLWIGLDASPFLLCLVALATLPALWDLISNRASGLRLSQDRLAWFSGPNAHEMPLDQIGHVRFDRRLDGSMRVSLVLTSGRKWRLPPEALPPPDTLETALQSLGVKTERHPFSLLG